MIKTSLKDGTAVISLNRPEKRNSLHPKLIEQLKIKFEELKYGFKCKSCNSYRRGK